MATKALKSLSFIGACILAISPALLMAQSLDDAPAPAEVPPASFAGNEFVDSRGCLFIRAEINGTTRWLPLVAQSRELVCDLPPTFTAQAVPIPEARPQTTAHAEPSALPIPAPIAQPPAIPREMNTAKQVVVVKPASNPACQARQPSQSGTCANNETVVKTFRDPAQQQVRTDGTRRYVPGRQVKIFGDASGTQSVKPHTRIVPRVAAANASHRNVVPPGYRPAFEDGRFNPYRAQQTLAGRSDMQRIWTNTVPRQLVDQRTRRVVSPDTLAKPNAVVSSKSTPQKTRTVAASHRFVEVGVFRLDGAQVAVSRLQNAGLPLRIRQFTHKGETLRMVLAGPFTEQAALTSALSTSQRLGFPGAKLLK